VIDLAKINIMIVDDIKEFTDFFSNVLIKYPDINIVTTASSGREAVDKAVAFKPDIILMDIQMESDTDGIEATKKILGVLPETKIIALTVHEDSNNISLAYEAGITDYLLKSASNEEIITAIRNCADTHKSISIKKILANDIKTFKIQQNKIIKCFNIYAKLSASEMDILRLLCEDMSYKEIAKKRVVEVVSVRGMINRISKKTGNNSIRTLIKQFKDCRFFEILDENNDSEQE